MKNRLTLPVLTALLAGMAQSAPLGTSWSAPALAVAKYVILEPRIEGNPNLVTGEQRAGILAAMKRDSAGAIQRHYPKATIVNDPQTPGAIKVTPVLVAPAVLLPWAKLTASLHFDLGGQRVTLNNEFGLLTLWQQQAEAANYVYNELVKKLP
ncbi:MAG: hypothetical protein AB1511_11005 [Deinococcota bacterium]